jgi:DNA-binding response OmpR family regulator
MSRPLPAAPYPRSVGRGEAIDDVADTDPADRLRRVAVELHAAHEDSGFALRDRLRRLSVELHEVAFFIERDEVRPNLTVVQPGVDGTEIVVDPDAFEVRINGEVLTLTFQEFRLLETLVDSRGRVLSRAQLMRSAWGREPHASERSIDVYVRRLRAQLGAAASRVRTVHGVGYRFD